METYEIATMIEMVSVVGHYLLMIASSAVSAASTFTTCVAGWNVFGLLGSVLTEFLRRGKLYEPGGHNEACPAGLALRTGLA